MKLESVILRDTRGSQPAATTVPVGSLYYVTDENVTERSNGTTWDRFTDAGPTRTLDVEFDGGGVAIVVGTLKDLYLPYSGTLTGVSMLADQSGSIVVDVWKQAYASYPPTVGNTITSSSKPTISTALKSRDTTLTSWTKTVTVGDTLRFHVDSVTSITRLHLTLFITPLF